MAIDSERMQMAFLAAVESADGIARAAIVARFADGDAEFAARLNVLLNAHDGPDRLPNLPFAQARDAFDGRDACQPGLLVAGRYRLFAEIGEGGTGSVWLAEQITPVCRRVAIKLLKFGMDTRGVMARFETERQALALMEHPFIARVFDGGVTESGRPFFVMEHVDGAPVTEFCDAGCLAIRERLRLFVDICQAVQHAHQKGVIHRDLKPSNVMVCRHEDRMVPKIIDFGLAKAMHKPLIDQAQQTGPAILMGTPRYMSPEQAEFNADIDTRADVYSLGVILYELLTGATPIDVEAFKDSSWAEIARQIKEAVPAKPSNRLKDSDQLPELALARNCTSMQACREVRGDLDWIALKALEKDRSRRYQTVGELARDVERFLDHRGVEARPPSARYRFSRFARRNRVMLGAGALVSVALIVGTVVSTAMAILARQAVKLAEAARNEEAMHREFAEQHRIEAELARARESEQREIAQNERNDAEQRREQAELSLQNVRAAAEGHFLALRNNQALSAKDQLPLRKELLSSALGYYRQLIDGLGDDPALRQECVLFVVRIGELSSEIGLNEQAIEAFQQATKRYEELIRVDPQSIEYHTELAFILSRLANLQGSLGLASDAEASCRRELAIRQTLVEMSGCAATDRLELGRAYCQFAETQRAAQRYHDAEASFQRAFEIYDAVGRETPLAGADHRYLADAFFAQGRLQRLLGRYSEAAQSFQRAAQLFEDLARVQTSKDPNYWAGVASAQRLLGNVRRQGGQLDAARESYTRSLELYHALLEQAPSDELFHRHLGSVHLHLGLLNAAAGQTEEATRGFEAALASFQSAQELGYASAGFTASRADALAMLGRWTEAAQTLSASVELRKPGCRIRSQLALLYWAAENSEAHRAQCRELVASAAGELQPGDACAIASACLVDRHSLEDWSPLLALVERAVIAAPEDPACHNLAAVVKYRAGRVDEAIKQLHKYLPLHDSEAFSAPTARDSVRASRLVGEIALMLIYRDREQPDALAKQAATVQRLAEQFKSMGPYYCDEEESWQLAFAVIFAERELSRLEQLSRLEVDRSPRRMARKPLTKGACSELAAWSTDVKGTQRGVDWRMKVNDAHGKRKSLYPKIGL